MSQFVWQADQYGQKGEGSGGRGGGPGICGVTDEAAEFSYDGRLESGCECLIDRWCHLTRAVGPTGPCSICFICLYWCRVHRETDSSSSTCSHWGFTTHFVITAIAVVVSMLFALGCFPSLFVIIAVKIQASSCIYASYILGEDEMGELLSSLCRCKEKKAISSLMNHWCSVIS